MYLAFVDVGMRTAVYAHVTHQSVLPIRFGRRLQRSTPRERGGHGRTEPGQRAGRAQESHHEPSDHRGVSGRGGGCAFPSLEAPAAAPTTIDRTMATCHTATVKNIPSRSPGSFASTLATTNPERATRMAPATRQTTGLRTCRTNQYIVAPIATSGLNHKMAAPSVGDPSGKTELGPNPPPG